MYSLVSTVLPELLISSCLKKYAGLEIVARDAFALTSITTILFLVARAVCAKI